MNEQFFDCLKREQDIRIKPKLRDGNGLQVEPHLNCVNTSKMRETEKWNI